MTYARDAQFQQEMNIHGPESTSFYNPRIEYSHPHIRIGYEPDGLG